MTHDERSKKKRVRSISTESHPAELERNRYYAWTTDLRRSCFARKRGAFALNVTSTAELHWSAIDFGILIGVAGSPWYNDPHRWSSAPIDRRLLGCNLTGHKPRSNRDHHRPRSSHAGLLASRFSGARHAVFVLAVEASELQ